MKLSSVLVLSVSATLAHKGDYQPFRAKTHKPKTLKVEPKGVFRAKTHKPKTLKDLPKSALGNGNSFPNIEEGREPQNSEDGGLVNGTLPSSGGGGGGGDDKLAFDFDEDYLPSDSVHNPLAENEGANFTSIQHTNELNGEENVTGVMSDDDDEVVVEDDDTMATGMNSTIDEGAQFSNDTTTESQEDEDYGIGSNGTESIKEDSLNESAEGGGAGANETSDNVTITTNEVDEDNVTEEVTGINETLLRMMSSKWVLKMPTENLLLIRASMKILTKLLRPLKGEVKMAIQHLPMRMASNHLITLMLMLRTLPQQSSIHLHLRMQQTITTTTRGALSLCLISTGRHVTSGELLALVSNDCSRCHISI